MKNLIIFGCGGHAKSVIDIVESTKEWQIKGLISEKEYDNKESSCNKIKEKSSRSKTSKESSYIKSKEKSCCSKSSKTTSCSKGK